jgi:hypothetical protein
MVFSCTLRFTQGALATAAALLLVVTSSEVIDIVLNFTAINFISALDGKTIYIYIYIYIIASVHFFVFKTFVFGTHDVCYFVSTFRCCIRASEVGEVRKKNGSRGKKVRFYCTVM